MKIQVLGSILILSLAAGCSQSDAAEPVERTEKQEESPKAAGFAKGEPAPGTNPGDANQPLTTEQIIQETYMQLNTRVPFTRPNTLPVTEGMHLTALTKSDAKSYEITFFETREPIPINNSKLKNLKEESKIATVKAKEYPSAEEAAEQTGYQKATPGANPPVDLGHGIAGYTDAGAGSTYLQWNEGRWLFASKAANPDSGANAETGKKFVSYLEKTMLPPPDQGSVHLDGDEPESRNHTIKWSKGNVLYEIEQPDGIVKGLQIAAGFYKESAK
ncbi:hypothetical protein GKZ89_08705 [Bacillus mangrovi]|uniref:Lipoprotein n=1 Tax=Metabacillus mangrovi TaxID=1491830 RepID=A0A7X2S659_9BACI|nr:hypothetical protein [Metabacillus mangrovi]MTH53496.1 hypothetical protein [Metabacillus mangrovi]